MIYVAKIVVSALLILAITELTKRGGIWGALLASLPLVSLISILWIYYDTRDVERIRTFSLGVFWLVLPSLGFFIVLPVCLRRCNFAASMLIAIGATMLLYLVLLWVLPKLGLRL